MDRLSLLERAARSPFSFVDESAQIAPDVTIGPFCVIGPNVSIGAGTRIDDHVTLAGRVTIGRNNHICSGAVLGELPAPGAEETEAHVLVGDHNDIRECVTIGSSAEAAVTIVGDHNLVMAACQLAAGCRLDNYISIANASVIGSGARINDHASLSGRVIVRENVNIGSYSFTGIASMVLDDVPPFVIVEGSPSRPRALNLVKLNRLGFSREAIGALGELYRVVFRTRLNMKDARALLVAACLQEPRIAELSRFVDQKCIDDAGQFAG